MKLSVIPAIACTAASACAQGQNANPNILFILADDLGIVDLGCYGSSFYETPNIDALASDGVMFTNGYASCPVSSPTRAAIMTGKYPARVGITDWIPGRQATPGANAGSILVPPDFTLELPSSEVTLGDAFRENGYQTFFVGKWHLGHDPKGYPQHRGFDVNIGGGRFGHPPQGYFSPYGLPNLEDGPQGEYLTERLTDECMKLLDQADPSQPFLLYYSMYQVHTPLQAKRNKIKYFEQKAREMGITEINQAAVNRGQAKGTPLKRKFVERSAQNHAVYAAMVSHMDDAVGKLVSKLKEMGIYDNTIIVFTSDNGGAESSTCNAPYRKGKGWPYEGGVRVPLIVRWPDAAKSGIVNESIVSSVDFYPSLLQMAGCPLRPEQHVDGKSFVPALRDGASMTADPVFWHYPHYSNRGGRPFGVVRAGDYKLIEHYEDMRVELFDLASDCGETTDISAARPEKTEELKNLLHRWRGETGARMPSKRRKAERR